MHKKPSKKQIEAALIEAQVEQMNAEAGRVYCPKCSTPDWKMYHKPGECPK